MAELAVDYAWEHPSPSEIAKAGYRYVLRYLSNDPTKDLTVEEAGQLQMVGLGIGVVWETTAQAPLTNDGGADGRAAVQKAQAIGYPKNCVVFGNVGDWSVTAAETDKIVGYFSGFRAAVLGAGYVPGGYGSAFVLDVLSRNALGAVWWQNAIDGPGFPGHVVWSHTSIYQRLRPTVTIPGSVGAYDENVVLQPVPWWGLQSIPTPTPGISVGDSSEVVIMSKGEK